MAGIRCHRCGRTGEAHALDWSSTVRDGGVESLCGPCTRHHVRDIEGKLEEIWWEAADRSVLVVEDDPATRLVIRMSLETAGYRVEETASGEEAIRRLQTGDAPSAIVADVSLAGEVDGWAVRERASTLPANPPVIMVSAVIAPGDPDPRIDEDFLPKPFDTDVLVALVDRRCADRSPMGQAGAGLA